MRAITLRDGLFESVLHHMLRDDRPDYPMTFTMQVELEGAADGEALESALEVALDRHPVALKGLQQPDVPSKQSILAHARAKRRHQSLSSGPCSSPASSKTRLAFS